MANNKIYGLLVELYDTPPEMMVVSSIPLFGLIYLFGLIPYFPKNDENNVIFAGISVIIAVLCFTYTWWVRMIPKKLRIVSYCLFSILRAVIVIGVPAWVVYSVNR
jgi:hypothetical protein